MVSRWVTDETVGNRAESWNCLACKSCLQISFHSACVSSDQQWPPDNFCISGGGSCQEDALITPKWWSALNTDALVPLSWAWAAVHLPLSPFSPTPALQIIFPLSVLRKSQIGLFTRSTHCYPPGLVKLQWWVVCQATKELEYIVSLYLDSL